MIVVDASVMVQATLGERSVARRLRNEAIAAPHLLDVDVVDALRRLLRRGDLRLAEAEAALDHFAALEITWFPHPPLIARAWAMRDEVSAYDAVYVALAESLGVPLLTLDARLASAPNMRATIELLPSW